MLKGNGMNGMGSMGGELMIEENEFIEKEREGVYNSIESSSKRFQSI